MTSINENTYEVSIRTDISSPDFTKIAELHNFTAEMGDINYPYITMVKFYSKIFKLQ